MKSKKNIVAAQVDWVNDPFRAFTTMVREPLFEYPKRLREMLNEGYEMPKVDIADKGQSFHLTSSLI